MSSLSTDMLDVSEPNQDFFTKLKNRISSVDCLVYSDVSIIWLSSLSDSVLDPFDVFLLWKRGVPKNEFLMLVSLDLHGPVALERLV